MKLYLACKDAHTIEGTFEDVLGVFDSRDKAWEHLKGTHNYELSKPIDRLPAIREYVYDGELSYSWYVVEVELNQGRGNDL